MTSISKKIDKWFIDVTKSDQLPPQTRHHWAPETAGENDEDVPLQPSNLTPHARATVTPLHDGEEYQREWQDSMDAMQNRSDPSDCSVFHAGWKMNNVETKGPGNDGRANMVVQAVVDAGVSVYLALSHHFWSLGGANPNDEFIANVGIETAALDNRFGDAGSIHQKFTVFNRPSGAHGIVGSVDIAEERWGKRGHSEEASRPTLPPTHDMGVRIEGPAVADLSWAFIERWNDQSRDYDYGKLQQHPGQESPPLIPGRFEPSSSSSQNRNHRVQVLLTYGLYNNYSWGERGGGELTAWVSYLNSIKTANDLIYIEDQYFAPFGDSSSAMWYEDQGLREYCPIFQLQRAIEENDVSVICVTNRETNSTFLDSKRNYGIERLRAAANDSDNNGEFHVAFLNNGDRDIYVHSKLMLCDDEFSLIGSTNINMRSMTHDGELQVGILDENESFTEQYRRDLWQEHLQQSFGGDLGTQVGHFADGVANSRGNLRPYPEIEDGSITWERQGGLDEVYGGPEQDILREGGS